MIKAFLAFTRKVGIRYDEVRDPWGSAFRIAHDIALGVAFIQEPDGDQ